LCNVKDDNLHMDKRGEGGGGFVYKIWHLVVDKGVTGSRI
jgi:hypothetical protein